MTTTSKQDKILLVISLTVGLVVAFIVGTPGKMYGGCGGHEVVVLSVIAQLMVDIAFGALITASAGAVTFLLGLVVIGLYQRATGFRPANYVEKLESGYKAPLAKPKLMVFLSERIPKNTTILTCMAVGTFGLMAVVSALKSDLYCPVNSNSSAVLSLLIGAVSSTVMLFLTCLLLENTGYEDGYRLKQTIREKARRCLPSMIQYYPMWAITEDVTPRRNNSEDLKTFLKSTLPGEYGLIMATVSDDCRNVYMYITHRGTTFNISMAVYYSGIINLTVTAEGGVDLLYRIDECECLASLMPLILNEISKSVGASESK